MDLANAAVEAVAKAVSAAATAAGGAIGSEAVDLVRRRLSGVDWGEEAVSAVEESPDDVDARSRLRERLSEVLSEDQEFAADLERALAPPKPRGMPSFSHSINIDRRGRGKGTFVIGPHSVTKIRKGNPGALVAVVAVVVVMAAAGYGIFRLATGGDSPPSPDPGHKVTALKDSAMVKAVAPDLHSMPSGWTSSSAASLTTGEAACRDLPDEECHGILSLADASFDNPYDQSAEFNVAAWESAADAQGFYDRVTKELVKVKGATEVAMPTIGDRSVAITATDDNENERGQALVQVGTVVAVVWEGSTADYYGNYELDKLQALTEMVAERAQEAQDGHTPTAMAGTS
ncbi:hypothetical protein ACFVJK_33045 [Streptomyces sp. NPDC127172]|uniref:hypothetical protein n=1 Tax=Streptomyces sp. NPDC127172 TaxID=3345382 RepID=UPI00362A1442